MKLTKIVNGEREWDIITVDAPADIQPLLIAGLEEATSEEAHLLPNYGWVIFEVDPIIIEVHAGFFSLVSEHLPRRSYPLEEWRSVFRLIREYWREVTLNQRSS